MRRIESRLRKLEAQREVRDQPQVRGLASVWHCVPIERKKNLGPRERVVVDWYRNQGAMTYGRERITHDPEDQGRKCKAGGYLLDVLEELHQSCSRKEVAGSCGDCVDTPVCEQRPGDSSSGSGEGSSPQPAEAIVLDDVDI
ncbi:MAG: hypothetical protein JWO19_4041 [Bryobacterales bacterium]|nr:hypothetical protein [Bryobacterales bacterium]